VSLLDFPPGLADGVRDVFMAGLGALATLEDEAQSLFSTLVKRGERWEAEARGAKADPEPDQAAVLAERLGQQLRTAVHDAVKAATSDRPTHADLGALREEVAALSEKLDALTSEPPAAPIPKTAVLEVRTAEGGGWVLTRDGEPAQTLPTKAAATEAAYLLGEEAAPAEIVLYKMNGDEQRRITLDAD
jgi:polyhydroxyalkanoate synthesis regulator phasin